MMEPHQRILVVDDDPLIGRMLLDLLRMQGYEVELVVDGAAALAAMAVKAADLLLLDVIMPGMDGYEVARRIRADSRLSQAAILMITGRDISVEKTKALEAGADDLLSKPICMPELLARVRMALSAKAHRERLEDERAFLAAEVARQTAALSGALEEAKAAAGEIVHRLARAADFRDDNTGAHIERVSHYAEVIAATMGLEEEECRLIGLAAMMHDVGKIGVPDAVLRKPGKLTPQEREIMQQHTHIGAQILQGSTIRLIRMAESIAMSHHEWWDGSGYPLGSSGDRIPLPARIVAVADALDAMTSLRPYRQPVGMDEALNEIQAKSGTQFDPAVAAVCLKVRDRLMAVRDDYPRQG